MIYSQNEQVLDKKGTKYPLDEGEYGTKLDVHVFDQRVMLLISEDFPPTYDAAVNREQMLEKGFHSIGFETAFTGFRLRAEDAATGNARVHFVAFG